MSLNNSKKGSVMIAALILTIITGTIVGFFLKSVTQEVTSSHRSRMSFQAINLAEAGLALIGWVIFPSSINQASEDEKTNLPLVIST